MNDPTADRQRRFAALWERLGGARAADAARRHEELESLYARPDRHYHTMRHIEQCLGLLDRHAELAGDADAIEAAIWYHDAIYDPGAPDNEARSAELFAERADGLLARERIDHVVELIMVTVHPSSPGGVDQRLLCDIDLSSFGLPRCGFLRDSVRVRREFGHLSLAEFWEGQRAFLDALLERPALYVTPPFHAALETPARENISAYRAAVERRLPDAERPRASLGR